MTNNNPSPERAVGRALLATAGVWTAYLVVAFTVANGYQSAVIEATEQLGVSENRLPPRVMSQIVREYSGGLIASSTVLLLAPAVLVVAARRARSAYAGPARWAAPLAVGAAAVWWLYLLITLGLFADPDRLPPLTRDLDVLSVPLVSASAALAVLAVVVIAQAARRAGRHPRTALAAAAIGVLLTVVGLADTVASGLDRPLPPVAVIAPALIMGIGLLRRRVAAPPRSVPTPGAGARR